MNLPWEVRGFSITVRLRIVFATVIALMLLGSFLSFWHFRNVSVRASRTTRAERRLTSVLRLNNQLLALMSQLHRVADKEAPDEFEAESSRLLTSFEAESRGAVAALAEISNDDGRYTVMVDSILGLLENLPRRVKAMSELAHASDWTALHARLLNQADQTDDVVDALMDRLDTDLGEERQRLTQDLANAQDRAISMLAITAALSLAIAVFLGAVVNHSIKEPLARLERGARALAAGDFSHRLPAEGNDELTQLGHAFNRMAGEIDRLFAEVRREHAKTESAQAALEDRARELARANADLQQFAYSASHDLQEPLRTLSLYSQKLQRSLGFGLDPGAAECVNFLSRAASQMQELIAGLLAYTRAGDVDREVNQPADLNEVLARVLGMLQVQIRDQRCTITANSLPQVRTHEIHAQQLLQNLIGNAIKYKDDKRDPQIEIRAQRKGEFWEVSVQDNGIGIEPQYTEQVFGIFKRLHGQQYSGTGIGLAICQRIVEGYGGQIWVESEPGRSSTFLFTLPAA
jgi:signal transduction histidine kinase